MMKLNFDVDSKKSLEVLCLGCHSDDIEIGCGGSILRLTAQYPNCMFHWVVFNAIGKREEEARHGAEVFAGAHVKTFLVKTFEDGLMPYVGADVKAVFEQELKKINPDVIFTHNGKDAHQDHRLISELTWNTFRNHFILEYEIPKYDGDMGRPSVFVPLAEEICQKKIYQLMATFRSQSNKRWFQPETFRSLMRLRGMECNAPSGYAEAFYCRKLVL
ncbi:MAG TPA: PIG-L deacetylase family protein [Candidatus Sulfotelmatobacter sp.]|nr:PIG-L deacetylase family protein [Candidatus Sulfotelmatobacter sp.]